jgi:hypothetical protein
MPEVVALISKVMAATPPTRKNTLWESSAEIVVSPCSVLWRRESASAMLTAPLKPPQVANMTSDTVEGLPSAGLRSAGKKSTIIEALIANIATYTTKMFKMSVGCRNCRLREPMISPARMNMRVFPIHSKAAHIEWMVSGRRMSGTANRERVIAAAQQQRTPDTCSTYLEKIVYTIVVLIMYSV